MTTKKEREDQAQADAEAGIQRDDNGDPTPNPSGFTDPTTVPAEPAPPITLEEGIPNPDDQPKQP